MTRCPLLLLFLIAFTANLFGLFSSGKATTIQDTKLPINSVFSVDFSSLSKDYETGLASLGFSLEKDMKNTALITLSGELSPLNIKVNRTAFGLLVNKKLNINKASLLELKWGINQFAQDANWEHGKNREGMMVYLFFGQPVDPGKIYHPDSPYFIGVFLGQHETTMKPFTGRSYSRLGRYICLANPVLGATRTDRFDFDTAFKKWFAKEQVPPITGIAIEVDTGSLKNGEASSFIEQISLLSTDQSTVKES